MKPYKRQEALLHDLYIARTYSPGAMAFWQLQVATLDDLVAFKLSTAHKARVAARR